MSYRIGEFVHGSARDGGTRVATKRVVHRSKAEAQRLASSRLVQAAQEVERRTKAQMYQLASREAKVANDLHTLRKKLSRPGQASRAAVIAASRRLPVSTKKKLAQVSKEIKTIDKQTQIFDARIDLVKSPELSASQKVALLGQLQDSVYEQESAIHRLKRMVTNPKFLLAVGLIGLAAYGLYRGPAILREAGGAAEKIGDAAERAGGAAEKTAESSATLASFLGCTALGIGGALGFAPGIPASLLCVGAAVRAVKRAF